jgi:hypothetical protein
MNTIHELCVHFRAPGRPVITKISLEFYVRRGLFHAKMQKNWKLLFDQHVWNALSPNGKNSYQNMALSGGAFEVVHSRAQRQYLLKDGISKILRGVYFMQLCQILKILIDPLLVAGFGCPSASR